MRPPYDPAHVEAVVFPDSQTRTVVARCGCGWIGSGHPLTTAGGVAQLLAVDLNGHRATYVAGAA